MKRAIKRLGIVLISVMTMYFGLYFIQGQLIKKSFIRFYGLEDIKEQEKPYSFKRCNLNVFNSEFAYLTGKNMALIAFYSPKKLFSLTNEDWDTAYTGGTNVKNTTFPELVKMVKKDCEQFKQGYLDYTGYEDLSEQEKEDRYYEIEAKNLGWTYTPYTPETPEPELTPEEKVKKEAWDERMRQEALQNRANAVPIEDLYK